jgi:hypothetical protein
MMARITRVSSEEDPGLVSPTEVGEDASESFSKLCRGKVPSRTRRRCSDGRNDDRTWCFQCTIGSKVVISSSQRESIRDGSHNIVYSDLRRGWCQITSIWVTRAHTGIMSRTNGLHANGFNWTATVLRGNIAPRLTVT